jgi:hypothetical protein
MRLNSVQKLDAADCHAALSNRFEAEHGSDSLFDSPVVLLNPVIEMFARPHSDAPWQPAFARAQLKLRYQRTHSYDDLPVKMPTLGEIGCCHAYRHDRPRLESHS